MNFSEITIKFTEYDGNPSTRPPVFECHPPHQAIQIPAHKLDGGHCFIMLIPDGLAQPLEMAFMLFWLEEQNGFEWVSKYSGKELCDEHGNTVPLDEEGYISFPLRKGDCWALWPSLPPH